MSSTSPRDSGSGGSSIPAGEGRRRLIAVHRGDLERVRRRVEAGADVTARDEQHGKTPVEWAEMGGHQQVIDYLRSVSAG